jgi:hypothetical protein
MAGSMVKGVITPDELSKNKGKLLIGGIPILFTKISAPTLELDTADLPDATRVSGGRSKPGDFTGSVPAHHFPEVRFLEDLYKKGLDPVDPEYKKSATLIFFSKTGTKFKSWNLKGCFCNKMTPPEHDLSNSGEMAEVEVGFSFDDIEPVI